ncbi:queuosine precursor transporter [Ignavibacterium sp.]|uniref:queuosine precursor transporter n=1 Tax=Ignavibacterium sp. TaxID=2651167 RepID=UPI00220D604B|nr:queuosine precursor transporter [Ignavibacterium sp.]BDQ02150.1 MAG: membrane protein [Ignavibacterium sp.]
MQDKSNRLFYILGAFFIANAILAEFIGVKIFSLEKTLGLEPLNLTLFGYENLSFNLTAGVLLWPIVFIMTDIINEYFGRKGVRFLSFTAAGLIAYAYAMVYFSISLTPADFWIIRDTPSGQLNMQLAFNTIFGQGLWIIIGSLVAFLIGQLVDVTVFHYFKAITGSSKIWLRATGSTLVSQFIDSFVVLFIAFYIGAGWDLKLVLAIGVVNYIYKFFIAVFLTPLLYIIHFVIDKYLGKELSDKLQIEATLK